MENSKQWIIPLIVFIVCFALVIFSINKIIKLAQPSFDNNLFVLKESPYNNQVTTLIKTPEKIDYQMLENKFPEAAQSIKFIASKFKINTETKNLPSNEQNYVIRIKLIKWRLDEFQRQIQRVLVSENNSLMYKGWFYFWGLMVWVGSIVGGRLLIFLSDEFIIPKIPKGKK